MIIIICDDICSVLDRKMKKPFTTAVRYPSRCCKINYSFDRFGGVFENTILPISFFDFDELVPWELDQTILSTKDD